MEGDLIMLDQQRGTDRAGRRAERFLSNPQEKYEFFLRTSSWRQPGPRQPARGDASKESQAGVSRCRSAKRLHSGIEYVTPDDEHEGRGQAIRSPERRRP